MFAARRVEHVRDARQREDRPEISASVDSDDPSASRPRSCRHASSNSLSLFSGYGNKPGV